MNGGLAHKIAQIGMSALMAVVFSAFPASAQIRASIGTPLKVAAALIVREDYRAAKVKVDEAAAVPRPTPEEAQIVSQMKAALAAISKRPDGSDVH